MTTDPEKDSLYESTSHPEGIETTDPVAKNNEGDFGDGDWEPDQGRFTEVTDEGEVRKVEGDPKDKLRRIREAKEGGE